MNKTRALTEGAIMASVYTILFLISFFVPFISLISTFFLSIPYTFYTYRHGLKKSYLFGAVTVVISVLFGSVGAIIFPLLYGSIGIVLGYLIKKKKAAFVLLLGASLVSIINSLISYIISILFLKVDPMDVAIQPLKDAVSMLKRYGDMLGTDVSQAVEQLEMAIEVVPYVIPSLIVLGSVVLSFIIIFVTKLVVKRFKMEVADWKPFREWAFPKSIIWYYLATMIIMFTTPEQGTTLYIVGTNLYFILEAVMVIQGFSFIYYYFWVKKKGKTLPVLVTIGALLLPIGFYVVRILGIIDIGFDLRKRIKA